MIRVNLAAIPWCSRSSVDSENCIALLHDTIHYWTGLNASEFYLLCNGKRIRTDEAYDNCTVQVVPRLFGGKGGFGSMLRAIGAQIEKTTNREACRDLSGRRLRDINEERRLKNWIAQKEEREKEVQERKRKRLERLCQEPKAEFKDEAFEKQRLELAENIHDSVEQGLKASTSGNVSVKRKAEETAKEKKKRKGLMLDSDMDSSDDSSSSDEEKPSTSRVQIKVESNSSDEEKPGTSGVNIKAKTSCSDDEKLVTVQVPVKLESNIVSVIE